MRVLAIVNARSGGSDAGLYDLARIAGAQGAEMVLRFLGPASSLDEMVSDVTSFDRVVAAGGDGTVSAVAYAIRDSGVPLLVFPAGTANLLALNLGCPVDSAALAEVLLNGTPARFDLAELQVPNATGTLERSGFAVMAGAGFDAQIMEAAQPIKSTFGAAAYLIAALGNIAHTPSRFELVLDGTHVSTEGLAVLMVNFGRIQFDLDITRDWDPQDGLLDVAVVTTKTVAGLLPVILGAMIDRMGEAPDRNRGFDTYRARRVEVSAYPPLKVQHDGETTDLLTPFAAQVLPGVATFLVQPESPYAQAPRVLPTARPETR